MQKTALVIMAAGIGSRFGKGIKQLAPVGTCGEIIMDYSIHDALEAGFNKVVFIIRKDLEEEFRRVIGERIEKITEVEYVFQELDDLPEGFTKPADRTKPWGTGQAVLAAKKVIKTPFIVINADDYYGREGFKAVHEYLMNGGKSCMAGFVLSNTLSDNGGVTRGICKMDEENKKFELAGKTFTEGDYISIDGSTGNIYDGIIPTVDASITGTFGRVMGWADKYRTMKVRTNADTPADAKKARELGAEGIGLCRTEHMFFEADRIAAFREMICSDTVEEREAALAKIEPMQQGDFEALYEALEGNPVTIRFLDPPLHEFVPTEEEDIKKLADAQGKTVDQIKAIIASLHEFNPMMGHRGCRLAVTYPEIAKMQTKAIIKAAINVKAKHPDWTVKPEIMIPLVGDVKELKFVKKVVVETADAEIAAAGSDLTYEVGTMIEIPRAALTADEIAKEADFFCFGTNDLTQMTYGFSRDDAGKFLGAYYDAKIFESDPFAKLDQTGVGKLMKMAIELGKPVNSKLHCGICGEHGGDPTSVEFCHEIGLDYVSCSPFRVPIARLAAAQAAIAEK